MSQPSSFRNRCSHTHAESLATGMPIAYLNWPDGRCLWSTCAYTKLLGPLVQELQGKVPPQYLPRPMTAEDALRWQQQGCQMVAPQ